MHKRVNQRAGRHGLAVAIVLSVATAGFAALVTSAAPAAAVGKSDFDLSRLARMACAGECGAPRSRIYQTILFPTPDGVEVARIARH